MKRSWGAIKKIISAAAGHNDLYLTVIDEEGEISCANANMLKSFDLKNPRSVKTNFFDLVHPVHVTDFKKTIQHAAQQKGGAAIELHIKNGQYHTINWQINYLDQQHSTKNMYFCLGYKIVNDDKLKEFSQLAEKYYPFMLEQLGGIIFHDKKGRLVATNQKTARLLNTTLENLYRVENISNLWNTCCLISTENGETVPFEELPFMKALQTGKAQYETLKVKLANGETRSLLFNSQLLAGDQTNGDCSAVSTIIDVTNEKSLVARTREKKALINAFILQTPSLAWVVDEDSRLILASAALYKYFGIAEKDSVNRKISELVPPSVYKTLYEKHIEVFETGKPVRTEERVKLADGTNYISHISLFPVEGSKGKKFVGGYAVNLADKTTIESELREANERLLTLNQATTNAIWEWDMQTGKIFRNETLMNMIGYQPDDAKGLSWWLRRIHPEDRNRASDKVKEATDNNQYSWQDEYRFKCADGTYKHIRDKGFVIYENGLPIKMIGSLQDISSLKDLENTLADERLQRQKEISETVIRVQEKERTRIGHELHDNVNQILSTTMLFVDMLTPDSNEQKQIKEKSLFYIKNAIDEIRKLSKELVVPQLKEQGLADSIQSLIDDIHLAHPIRIKFTHDLESDLLSSGKRTTLFRIVQEQLKNILKHSKAKKAEITLQTMQDDVRLIIKDNGVGFDSTKTHQGIGLSNIYERVSFYNGSVTIDTAPGKGCSVTVTLSLI
jgi:PAS domain S-box-containing protein